MAMAPISTGAAAAGTGLGDILTSLQQTVQQASQIVDGLGALSPHYTSGRLSAQTLVQSGFVRVTGISLLTAMVGGYLNDAASIGAALAGNQVYAVPASTGYVALNIVFQNGLVYSPVTAAQAAALFYTRT